MNGKSQCKPDGPITHRAVFRYDIHMGAVLTFKRKVQRIRRIKLEDELGVSLEDARALCEGLSTGIYCTECADPLRPDMATCPELRTPNPFRV